MHYVISNDFFDSVLIFFSVLLTVVFIYNDTRNFVIKIFQIINIISICSVSTSVVSFNKLEQAMEYFKQRWQIETLFRGLKSSGFNIEDTHVTDLERLGKLFSLTMIAFVWCYKIGDYLDENIKRIKIKNHGRRAVSIFKYGLDYLSKFLLTGIKSLENNLFYFLSCT